MIKYLTMTIGKQKNIALIAHDGKKQDMLKWCMDNKEILRQHNLSGTGTTARMIADHVGLKIKGYKLNIKDGEIQTSKKYEIDEHGVGIKNIIEVITKYQGSYAIRNENNEFYFSVILPN